MCDYYMPIKKKTSIKITFKGHIRKAMYFMPTTKITNSTNLPFHFGG